MRSHSTLALLAVVACHAPGAHSLAFFNEAAAPSSAHAQCETENCGEPLNISPLLLQGKVAEARAATRVTGLPGAPAGLNASVAMGNAGFITTQPSTGNHMFFWYFPAQSGDKDAPLLIWLQGGPGGSSLFGLFSEMGPFSLSADLKLVPRNSTWNKKYSMLFIDNPVGAGFSYTKQDAGYCTNTKVEVAKNLYSLMTQFYVAFPETKKVPLYITGESYGGHYVPGFAHYIMTQNDARPEDAMPLAGIAVGDGWIDPVTQMGAYPAMMFNMGLIDTAQREVIQSYCDTAVAMIQQGAMLDAFKVWDKMLNGDVWPYHNLFHNMTGSNDYDNFMNTNAPVSFGYYSKYVNLPATRAALHVGDAVFNNGHECEMHLLSDFMVSLKTQLGNLMDRYKVLIYSGQLDVIIGAATTEAFLPTVPWSGVEDYNRAPRKVWRMAPSDPEVAGYVRTLGNFTQAVIRGAGHIAPYDQPERSLEMITRFVEGTPYTNYPDPVKAASS